MASTQHDHTFCRARGFTRFSFATILTANNLPFSGTVHKYTLANPPFPSSFPRIYRWTICSSPSDPIRRSSIITSELSSMLTLWGSLLMLPIVFAWVPLPHWFKEEDCVGPFSWSLGFEWDCSVFICRGRRGRRFIISIQKPKILQAQEGAQSKTGLFSFEFTIIMYWNSQLNNSLDSNLNQLTNLFQDLE